MSDSSEELWSDSPNAPLIPRWLYLTEKVYLAGNFIGAIFYGVVIVLFFQCMGALFNPIYRTRGGIKWGLVAHTAAMFSVLTIAVAMSLDLYPISYIDNREFSGNLVNIPGPYGYEWLINSKAICVVPNIMFFLNTCLADGFLLYRCYVIYSMSYWVIALPCLMYLASVALGITITYYQSSTLDSAVWNYVVRDLGTPYLAISLSLNVLLTLMVATRLILHRRNIRNAIGPGTDSGLYNTVVTMLVESCVLYAVGSLLYIGSLGVVSIVEGISAPIFVNIQVIAPFLIILRVANRTALTRDAITSGKIGSIRFKSRGESMGGNETLPGGDPVCSIETNGGIPGELGVEAGNIIEEVPVQ